MMVCVVLGDRAVVAWRTPDASRSSSKDKFFERVINSYLSEVMKHPQAIEMCEGVLHIQDVQGPKKTGTMEDRLEVVEHEIFRCQRMVDHGLSADHSMITEDTSDQTVDGRSLKDIVFTLNEQIHFLKTNLQSSELNL
ncbi:40S ribosomal protein S5-1 [Hordeum vulgare]|nr:40S ribosomal protein S5-1 [Hordeum vulgare]